MRQNEIQIAEAGRKAEKINHPKDINTQRSNSAEEIKEVISSKVLEKSSGVAGMPFRCVVSSLRPRGTPRSYREGPSDPEEDSCPEQQPRRGDTELNPLKQMGRVGLSRV